MISKHVPYGAAHDNYGALIRYIADASHEGEKCLASWCARCVAEDDYKLAIVEAQAAQTLNTRSQKEKTYHLLISFRPEDEAKLTKETFKAIEKRFAVALGFFRASAALWHPQEYQQYSHACCLQHDSPGAVHPA